MTDMDQCAECAHNVKGMCLVSFMSVEQAKSYLGSSSCASRNIKMKPPKLIGICGYARAGKDTAADMIHDLSDGIYYRKAAFANVLKDECNLMLSMVDDEFPDLHLEEDKIKYRDFLVFWGKFRREKFRPDYWIDKLVDSIDVDIEDPDRGLVISDVRYPNEAKWIKDRGGIVFYIDRPGVVAANYEEAGTIGEILEKKLYDIIIHNNGTLEDLADKICGILGIFRLLSEK